MPTELDVTLDTIMDKLTGEGGQLATQMAKRHGQDVPEIAAAPPSLPYYFAHFCDQHGDTPFLVDGDVRLSFAETYAAASAAAQGLVARHGIEKGDRIGIAARNSANWIVAYMATVMAGGVATLLNGFFNGEELTSSIKLAECRLVLADAGRAARLEGQDHGAEIVTFRHGVAPAEGLAAIWPEEGQSADLPHVGAEDIATILYTSGSTGDAKGAYSDHRGVVQGVFNYIGQTLMALAYVTSKGEAPTNQPATLLNVPLFHVTGEVPVFLQSFAIGRKLVLMPKWDAGEALRLIEAEKVTYFVGVPLMSYELATHPDREKYDTSTCISFAAGGAPRPVDHVERIHDAFPQGFPLLGYGLTETNAVGCGNFNENYLAKPGSTGKPSRPLVEMAMLDDAGNQLPQGEVGEVSIRSVCNFLGYWKNEEATKAAITEDGWFRTGDLGYLDEDGYLFIVDRKKDIIIRGGENISCIEVEEAIYAHEDVAECSVFGLDDERFGEVPAAVYVLREGSTLSEGELRDFLAGKLAPFKIPQTLWHSQSGLPRLGTAKVDKRAVKAIYAQRA